MKNKLTRASSYKRFKAAAPSLVSMSNALKSTPAPKALRSPFSNAPSDWSRFAAADANRRSPPHGVTSMRYNGAERLVAPVASSKLLNRLIRAPR